MKSRGKIKWISLAFGAGVVVICTFFPVGCTVFGVRTVEEASYKVLNDYGQIELREYDELLTIETSVDADYKKAGEVAFRRLFAYINGENDSKTKIAMTSPVIANEGNSGDGERIAMTTPIFRERQNKGWRYLFVLPASYTLDSAPAPLNSEIKLSVMPKKQVAVIRYTGKWSEEAMRKKSDELAVWIQENNLESVSMPLWAGYDPPWTIPFLRRNEVMIDVK